MWVGGAGQALAEHTIRQTIIGRTQAVLGVPINPHLFRDCAATTLAIEDPAHVGAAATILGHAIWEHEGRPEGRALLSD
jgi:hypothetical protein